MALGPTPNLSTVAQLTPEQEKARIAAMGPPLTAPLPVPTPSRLSAPGVKVLNYGPPGTGKTHSLSTIPPEYKVRILFTENGQDSLGRAFAERGQKIPPNFAWHYVKMAKSDFSGLLDMTQKIGSYDLETLTKLPVNAQGRAAAGKDEFYQMLAALANFVDDRTGEVLGDASKWGNDTVLVIDSITGFADAMMRLVCGLRPTRSQMDWQVVQNHLERVFNVIAGLECHVIVNGHWEREPNEVTGSTEIMLSLPGRKLANKLPRFWSDVLISRRDVDKYYWTTVQANADVKTRHLSLSATLPPNYATLLANWRRFAEAGS